PNDSKERFGGLGVQVIEGAARFKDSSTVVVGNVEVKARRFVVATGSRAAVPGIEGLAATPFFTNETIFDLKRAPEHLVIIGAGAVGLELAQAFRRFGAQVTVLEAATALSAADPECATVVLDQLRREGIVIRERVAVTRVGQQDGKIAVVVNDDATAPILGSDLLVAVGRRPNLEGLELDAAGIKYSARGIAVGKGLKSSNKRVYAVGDVVGGQFTHAANFHAGLVIRNALFRLPVRANDDILPWVTFTDPELAHVGLDEAQARARFKTIWVLRWPYHENDRAQAERLTQGHIKVITKKNGLIIGCTIVGAQAGELIAPWTLAVTQRLNIRHMAGIVVPYPTLSEIGKRAAMSYFSASLSNPRLRRLITFLRRFG
ncbi:MAG: FAD-dependent oxidoreductase, partial [Alphaproteobacteria bacterium]|nr:FAD-dependent oxidoreductase [Alphaproteobacteria bacterium]